MRRTALWAVAVVALLAVGALLAEFAPLGPLARGGDGVGATEPAPDPPAPLVTTPPADVTAPPAAAPAPTEAPPTTTAPAPTVPAFGEPIPIRELTLAVDGIGPLQIGSDGNEVFGRLVATFGQPHELIGPEVSDGDFGTCPGEQIRVARFGTLAAINVVDDTGREAFAGYVVDLDLHGDGPDPAADLRTISGLRAGDTVGDLARIYAHMDVAVFEGPDELLFELRRPSDGVLLLTGPVTGQRADDDANIVRGIASPAVCG